MHNPAPSRRGRTAAAALTATAVLAAALTACSSSGDDPPSAAGAAAAPASQPAPGTAGTAQPPASASTPGATAHPTATATGSPSSKPTTPTPNPAGPAAPPPHAAWDYQLGGAYPPPKGVAVVSRDSTANPAPGLYNICYINAYQVQPGSEGWWQQNHPDLLLRDKNGNQVVDQDWNEPLLDVSTDAKRTRLAQIEDGWIDGCAAKGFQAVEPDNYDSYSRSQGLFDPSADIAFAALIARHAHTDKLAVAQKNGAEMLDRRAQAGFDFAVAEQCGQYDECGQYAAAYDGKVVDVEYDDTGFAKACQGFGGRIPIVRRDRDVTPPGSGTYVYKSC